MVERENLKSVFAKNTPDVFWRCLLDISSEEWLSASRTAAPLLPGGDQLVNADINALLEYVLGEGYLGANRWRLSPLLRALYLVRNVMPQYLVTTLRILYQRRPKKPLPLNWPIEDRYVRFQWATMSNILVQRDMSSVHFIAFWPEGRRFAFVLTHDVDSQEGYDFVLDLAAVEEQYGFRSSFNFVPERYCLDRRLLIELQERGFEIGVHGLRHDGRLFSSRRTFEERAFKINRYLSEWGAVGFRSPLTHRYPEWMQILNIMYDTSFFDTDPYETMAGGTMSIWPFFIGRFVELPYTLAQDHTLMISLRETSPRLWLDKLEFIAQHSGMALLPTHPDYLRDPSLLAVYEQFMRALKQRDDYWHVLPSQVARWWQARAEAKAELRDGKWSVPDLPGATIGRIELSGHGIEITT